MNIEAIASQHAGRQLVKGVTPWLREEATYSLTVNGEELNEKQAWQWILAERPDLANYGSLRAIHTAHAKSRWLTISHHSHAVEIIQTDGQPTDYTFDWYPVETLWREETETPHGLVESARQREQLQLRAPDGTLLGAFEERIHEWSRGNYPTGDYSKVEDVGLIP